MFSYEPGNKPLLSAKKFYKRLFNNFLLAVLFILISLTIGIGGYMFFAKMNFVDALLNASMILGGMGPVDPLSENAAKYFASFYALFSGITFLSTVVVLVAPIVHRVMHKFHLETEDDEEKEEKDNEDKK
jgi:flagellar biosynthesis protein FliR